MEHYSYLVKIPEMWKSFKQQIMTLDVPQHCPDVSQDVNFKEDAYNSLSIEGYRIPIETVDDILSDDWTPHVTEDRVSKDALVARGYFLAFCEVRNTIIDINKNHLNPGTAVKNAHMDWYTEMWKPFVLAGLYSSKDIIGYRNRPVYIKGSRHVPPSDIKVLDYMDEFFYCL